MINAIERAERKTTWNSRSGIPGNMYLEKFPREFPGILLRSAVIFLYTVGPTIISSFDNTVQDIGGVQFLSDDFLYSAEKFAE